MTVHCLLQASAGRCVTRAATAPMEVLTLGLSNLMHVCIVRQVWQTQQLQSLGFNPKTQDR